MSLLRTTILLGVTALVTMGATSCQWVMIVDPASGTSFTTAQTVTIEANTGVSPEVATVTKVEFRDNGTLRCTDSTAPYQCNWSVSSSVNGDHSWVAKALLSNGDVLQSEPAALKVAVGGTPSGDPVLVGFLPGIGTAADVAKDGNRVFIASGEFGLATADTTNPSAPSLLGSSDAPFSALHSAVRGSRGVVAGAAADSRAHFWVLDLSDVSMPVVRGELATNLLQSGSSGVRDIVLDGTGSRAVAAVGADGLWVIDLTNPAAPSVVGQYNTPGTAYGVALVGSTAYVADHTAGLQIVSIATPSRPALLGTISLTGAMRDVAVVNNLAYVSNQNGGFKVVDVTNPGAPRLVGIAGTSVNGFYIAAEGTRAVVMGASGTSGAALEVFDVSNPAQPRVLGKVGGITQSNDFAFAGGFAYVADGAEGLKIFDLRSPASASLAGQAPGVGALGDVGVRSGMVYAADSWAILSIFDLGQ